MNKYYYLFKDIKNQMLFYMLTMYILKCFSKHFILCVICLASLNFLIEISCFSIDAYIIMTLNQCLFFVVSYMNFFLFFKKIPYIISIYLIIEFSKPLKKNIFFSGKNRKKYTTVPNIILL